MNLEGRQLDTAVEDAVEGEQVVAENAQRQNLHFDESNMGRASVSTQAAVRNRIREGFKPDTTYKSVWRRFKEFVSAKRVSGELDNDVCFLTREAVDLYFAVKVSSMTCSNSHAARFASALQKYSDCLEHIGKDFAVKSGAVIESLDAQKIFKQDSDAVVQAKKPGHNLPCPHKGLRVNLCTPAEDLKMMEYIYSVAPPEVCHHLSFSWSLGRTTFLRGKSMRVLRYYNLFTSDVFGPEPEHEWNKHALLIILRKGNWLIVVFFYIFFYFSNSLLLCALTFLLSRTCA